jgi:hypothetical protein
MLGRKDYEPEELDHARTAISAQVTAYRAAVPPSAAREAFEAQFFNALVLVLDRYFVHRFRAVAGKDGNPLNEVEMLADSLMNNGGTLRKINVIKYVPEGSVLKLKIGDPIRLTESDFERLSTAFLAEIESKFIF